jgi:uncharacterized membrane protein HdeD (DUF308 family)
MSPFRVAGRADVFIGGAWQAAFVIGCISVGLGAVLLVWPNRSASMSEVLFGVVVLLSAAWQLVLAGCGRISAGLKVLEFVTALVAVMLAMGCIRSGDWVSLVALWVGLGWVVHGIVQATVAVWSDALPRRGSHELSGVLTLFAGILVIIWPIDTLDALSVLVGVCLILMGTGEIRTSSRIDRPVRVADTHVGVHGLLRSQS